MAARARSDRDQAVGAGGCGFFCEFEVDDVVEDEPAIGVDAVDNIAGEAE